MRSFQALMRRSRASGFASPVGVNSDVLGNTGFIGSVDASTMWQCAVPNDKIACFTRNWNCAECFQIPAASDRYQLAGFLSIHQFYCGTLVHR